MAKFKTRKGTANWKLTETERRLRREAKRVVVPLDIDRIMESLAYGVDTLPSSGRWA